MSRRSVEAGRITFNLDTTDPAGLDLVMFRPTRGTSAQDVFADYRQAFAGDVTGGVRNLEEDGIFVGLAGVIMGHPASITEILQPGTYYLTADFAALQAGGDPAYSTLLVRDRDRHGMDGQRSTHSGSVEYFNQYDNCDRRSMVRLTSAGRFQSPTTLPASGSVTIKNSSKGLHDVKLWQLQAGTTAKKVQAWLDDQAGGGSAVAPFAEQGASVEVAALSSGRSLQLRYALPAGTYLLFSELPDDRTGIPPVFAGMWTVVTLR